jgi:microcystin-dependent protein
MGQPFVGEIRMFAGNFAPAGWHFCDGAPMPISENDVLFTLIGTTYGGDGQETFNLPNFLGRVPIHMGTGGSGTTYQMGEMAGVETVTLTTQQIPAHNHAFLASTDPGGAGTPQNGVLATEANVTPYRANLAPTIPMAANMLGADGGSQPHENLQPLLCINYIISLFGVFPTQT